MGVLPRCVWFGRCDTTRPFCQLIEHRYVAESFRVVAGMVLPTGISACLDLPEGRLAPIETKSCTARMIDNVKCGETEVVICKASRRCWMYHGRATTLVRAKGTKGLFGKCRSRRRGQWPSLI